MFCLSGVVGAAVSSKSISISNKRTEDGKCSCYCIKTLHCLSFVAIVPGFCSSCSFGVPHVIGQKSTLSASLQSTIVHTLCSEKAQVFGQSLFAFS